MLRFTTAPAMLLGLVALFALGALAAPTQIRAAGLDFWNMADEQNQLRETTDAGQELDLDLEQIQRRNAVADDIAAALCDDRITLPEALESVAALAEQRPDWFALLRVHYCHWGKVPPAVTDRDVMACFLRIKIESRVWTTESLSGESSAAVMSARLVRFDNEVRDHGHSPPVPHSSR